MRKEVKVALLMICSMLIVTEIYLAINKKPVVIDLTATAASQPKPIPLVQVINSEPESNEFWVAASQFEPVDYTGSLYVAQAHRPGEHESVNRFVFLDTRACMGQSIRIPGTGEKFKVLMYSLRIGIGSPNVVSEKPASIMLFVRPPCR